MVPNSVDVAVSAAAAAAGPPLAVRVVNVRCPVGSAITSAPRHKFARGLKLYCVVCSGYGRTGQCTQPMQPLSCNTGLQWQSTFCPGAQHRVPVREMMTCAMEPAFNRHSQYMYEVRLLSYSRIDLALLYRFRSDVIEHVDPDCLLAVGWLVTSIIKRISLRKTKHNLVKNNSGDRDQGRNYGNCRTPG